MSGPLRIPNLPSVSNILVARQFFSVRRRGADFFSDIRTSTYMLRLGRAARRRDGLILTISG
jgi:hypothetical protein